MRKRLRSLIVAATPCMLFYAATLIAEPAGEALMEQGGCISCHRIAERLIGPSFKEVSARYRGRKNADKLFDEVRNGSEGQWGDLPMPPTAAEKLSDAQLRIVIEWVLQQQ
jgi:cytochrome c